MSQSSARSVPSAGRLTALFSKRPVPGEVKTRLCPPLSPQQAAGLAEAMLRDAVARCSGATAFHTTLWFAPEGAGPWFEAAFPGVSLAPQLGGNLAERLARAFADGLALPGIRTMVAIGSDQPTLAAARIGEAHARLEAGADLVLAPDAGGGYVLVGMREPRAELFTRIPMSTPGMCSATVSLARDLGLRVELLPEGLDVDVEADLRRLRDELRGLEDHSRSTPDFPRHTTSFLERLRLPAP